jgi:hypothetical protein
VTRYRKPFSHQLGTLEVCRDDLHAARRYLQRALRLRQLNGDRKGAAATRHNLELLEPLPSPPPPRPSAERKPTRTRPLAVAALVVSVLAAGAGLVTMAVPANHETRPVLTTTALAPPGPGNAVTAPAAHDPASAAPGSLVQPITRSSAPALGTPGISTSHATAATDPTSPSPRPATPLSAQPAQIDFGRIDITPGAAASSKILTLRNPNDRAITVQWATIAGSPAYTIADTDCTAHPIPSHSTCTVDLRFAPHVLGPSTARILLTQAKGEVSTIPLTGSGYTELNLTIDPPTVPVGVPAITVQDDHGLLTCHTSCQVQVTSPAQATLILAATPSSTAPPPNPIPSTWFAFDQWLGDCLPLHPGQPSCTLQATRDTHITAYFVEVSGPTAAATIAISVSRNAIARF